MCRGQASSSKMLDGKACVVGADVAECRPIASRCGAIVLSDSSRSYNNGEVTGKIIPFIVADDAMLKGPG